MPKRRISSIHWLVSPEWCLSGGESQSIPERQTFSPRRLIAVGLIKSAHLAHSGYLENRFTPRNTRTAPDRLMGTCAMHPTCFVTTKWWPLPGLNRRQIGYEPTALTAELRGRGKLTLWLGFRLAQRFCRVLYAICAHQQCQQCPARVFIEELPEVHPHTPPTFVRDTAAMKNQITELVRFTFSNVIPMAMLGSVKRATIIVTDMRAIEPKPNTLKIALCITAPKTSLALWRWDSNPDNVWPAA